MLQSDFGILLGSMTPKKVLKFAHFQEQGCSALSAVLSCLEYSKRGK